MTARIVSRSEVGPAWRHRSSRMPRMGPGSPRETRADRPHRLSRNRIEGIADGGHATLPEPRAGWTPRRHLCPIQVSQEEIADAAQQLPGWPPLKPAMPGRPCRRRWNRERRRLSPGSRSPWRGRGRMVRLVSRISRESQPRPCWGDGGLTQSLNRAINLWPVFGEISYTRASTIMAVSPGQPGPDERIPRPFPWPRGTAGRRVGMSARFRSGAEFRSGQRCPARRDRGLPGAPQKPTLRPHDPSRIDGPPSAAAAAPRRGATTYRTVD
jgi:hypothetical protein